MATKKTPKAKVVKPLPSELIRTTVEDTDASVSRRGGASHKELPIGKYALQLTVSATKETLYIPASIGSGRVSTGFVYHIEGTEKGTSEAKITCRGEGIATITSGSISFWKLPVGKTALIKIYVQVTGSRRGRYKIVVSRINFKLNPNDQRYTRFLTEIGSKTVELRD